MREWRDGQRGRGRAGRPPRPCITQRAGWRRDHPAQARRREGSVEFPSTTYVILSGGRSPESKDLDASPAGLLRGTVLGRVASRSFDSLRSLRMTNGVVKGAGEGRGGSISRASTPPPGPVAGGAGGAEAPPLSLDPSIPHLS